MACAARRLRWNNVFCSVATLRRWCGSPGSAVHNGQMEQCRAYSRRPKDTSKVSILIATSLYLVLELLHVERASASAGAAGASPCECSST